MWDWATGGGITALMDHCSSAVDEEKSMKLSIPIDWKYAKWSSSTRHCLLQWKCSLKPSDAWPVYQYAICTLLYWYLDYSFYNII